MTSASRGEAATGSTGEPGPPTRTVLRIDASARRVGSATRALADRLIDRMTSEKSVEVIERDLAAGVPLLSESTLVAMWTPEEHRSEEHRDELTIADEYIDELRRADAAVIGLPIYNFGPPAAMKAWADLVARAGTTFRYTERGPEGLVDDKPVFVLAASGGIPIGSPGDLASVWLTTFLGFLGISNVQVIPAGGLEFGPGDALESALRRVDEIDVDVFA